MSIVVGALLGAPTANADPHDEVHECDEYAAHPNDPNRWAKGVIDEDIIPGPAVKFCRDAVDDYAETPRFHFQLGRALWAAHQFEEGLQVFLTLEEQSEYGPVYAYLGDAFMYGIGGAEPDEELAISLYQIADEEGFVPASEVLAALSDDAFEVAAQQEPASAQAAVQQEPVQRQASQQTQQQTTRDQQQPAQTTATAEPVFDMSIFFEKKILRALNDGDIKSVRMGEVPYLNIDKSTFYLSGFLAPFQQNLNWIDQSCTLLANPTLVRTLNIRAAQNNPVTGMFAGNGRSLEQNLNAGGEMGWKMLGDMLQGMQSGRGVLGTDMGRMQIEAGLMKEHGEKDATRMIQTYGCQSPITQRIMANISYFVTQRGSPQMSPASQQRRAAEQVEKARKAEERRQKQMRVAAQKSCLAQFKKDAYCGCLIEGLDANNIADAEWQRLGKSFKEVIAIGKSYSGFADQIKTCRSKT